MSSDTCSTTTPGGGLMRRVSLLGLGVCATLTLALAGVSSAVAAGWAIQPVPVVVGGLFDGVSCSTATACRATGLVLGASFRPPLAESWNGGAWSVQATPIPGGAVEAPLAGVSCAQPGACTAVGYSATHLGGDNSVTLAERWSGASWSVQPTSNPAGAASSKLNGVSCTSSVACMAVGYSADAANNDSTLAERWNGASWSIVPTPSAAGVSSSVLTGVSCISPQRCTAVGDSIDVHGRERTLVERWNGANWSIEPSPNRPHTSTDALLGVSCVSKTACTAVGYFVNEQFTKNGPIVARRHGHTWSLETAPNPADSAILQSVSCTAVFRCTAVGTTGPSGHNHILAERRTPAGWHVQVTPEPPGAADSHLLGVSCTAPRVCTAIGYWSDIISPTHALVERSS